MEKNNLFNFFKQSNRLIRLVKQKESEEIIRKMISVANGDKLHYLWSNYRADSFIIRKKVSCDPDLYLKTLNNTIVFDDMYFIIDKVCLSDCDDDLVIELSKADLIELLHEFYWDLDEIYMFDPDPSVFISINHNFELSLYGDKGSALCKKILEKIAEISPCNE